jgi:transcriptional regulator with XRE-family HTH domain
MEHSPADPVAAFAARLRMLRLKRGLSQEALAHMAGLDRSYVSSCEAGRRNVTIKTICRFAAALQVEAAELLGGVCGERVTK